MTHQVVVVTARTEADGTVFFAGHLSFRYRELVDGNNIIEHANLKGYICFQFFVRNSTEVNGVKVTCYHVARNRFSCDAAVRINHFFAEVGETNVLRDFVAQVGGINHALMFIRVGAIRCVAEEDERRTGFYGTAHDFFSSYPKR